MSATYYQISCKSFTATYLIMISTTLFRNARIHVRKGRSFTILPNWGMAALLASVEEPFHPNPLRHESRYYGDSFPARRSLRTLSDYQLVQLIFLSLHPSTRGDRRRRYTDHIMDSVSIKCVMHQSFLILSRMACFSRRLLTTDEGHGAQ